MHNPHARFCVCVHDVYSGYDSFLLSTLSVSTFRMQCASALFACLFQYCAAAASIWFEIWGGRGSGSKNFDFLGKFLIFQAT